MNHFDKQGNYINEENLSLREIYEQGFSEGVRRSSMPVIMKTNRITCEEKRRIIEEWKKMTSIGLVFVRDDIEVICPPMAWIPVIYRDLTEEETNEMRELYGDYVANNPQDCWAFDNPLPEDGQTVLICTKYGVETDEFCFDDDCGYFENHPDRDDLLAWMPLPEPYSGKKVIGG